MNAIFASKKTWIALLLTAGLACLGWWQREPIVAWHTVRQLANASPDNCEEWANRVAALDDAAVPRLLDRLQCQDAQACANLQSALAMLARRWGPTNPRSIALVEEIRGRFSAFSLAGQEQALLSLTNLLQQDGPRPLPPKLTKAVSEVLIAAEKQRDLQPAALRLAAELVVCVQPGQWADVCRAMAERGMKDEREATRVAAVHLVLREPLRQDRELLEQVIPLLSDPEASVRRAAVVALAPAKDVIREETLLPLLHDEDAQVQYLCEMALHKRGLTDDDLKLARLISDKAPATRLRVLRHLDQMPDLNLREWLRQLSLDPAPAVRAAAVRAMGENLQIDLSERLREMAERDPSETVRQNALYYLRQRATRVARD
jgi:HEAT repeat protein